MKTFLIALALTLAPGLSFAECGHDTAASCAPGMQWDADLAKCVPTVSS